MAESTTGQEAVFIRQTAAYKVLYTLTQGVLESADVPGTAGKPYYGVYLHKTAADGSEEDSGPVGISENKETALAVLRLLYDMEVTPMSLTEVIDTAGLIIEKKLAAGL